MMEMLIFLSIKEHRSFCKFTTELFWTNYHRLIDSPHPKKLWVVINISTPS